MKKEYDKRSQALRIYRRVVSGHKYTHTEFSAKDNIGRRRRLVAGIKVSGILRTLRHDMP